MTALPDTSIKAAPGCDVSRRPRDNPFAMERVEAIGYRMPSDEFDQLAAGLAQLKHRGAIVGPHGSGKTTLLEDMGRRLALHGWRVVWCQLTSEFPQLAPEACNAALGSLTSADFVILDGAEQLNWLAWRRFLRKTRPAGGLLISTHSPGRLPTLHRCATSPQLLATLIRELLAHRAAHDVAAERWLERLAADLFALHGGNLREALRACYDLAASGGMPLTR